MSDIIASIAGAPQAANSAGGYYQTAANDVYNTYGPNATQQFVRLQNEALRPQFNQQDEMLSAAQAAQGLGASGAGRANYGNLGAQQSATLAGADAPLFSQGLGAAAGVYGAMPGAQVSAYDQSIQDFYNTLTGAGQYIGMQNLAKSNAGNQQPPPSGDQAPPPYYG